MATGAPRIGGAKGAQALRWMLENDDDNSDDIASEIEQEKSQIKANPRGETVKSKGKPQGKRPSSPVPAATDTTEKKSNTENKTQRKALRRGSGSRKDSKASLAPNDERIEKPSKRSSASRPSSADSDTKHAKQAKKPRMTRQNSREALQLKETPPKDSGNDESKPKSRPSSAKSGVDAVNKPRLTRQRSRETMEVMETNRRHGDDKEDQEMKVEVPTGEKKRETDSKRRKRAISESESSENSVALSEPVATETKDKQDDGETDKTNKMPQRGEDDDPAPRKKLKRPLPTGEKDTKKVSTASMKDLLDREEMNEKKEKQKKLAERQASNGDDGIQLKKKNVSANESPPRKKSAVFKTVTKNLDGADRRIKEKAKARTREDRLPKENVAASLDDYLKAKESKPVKRNADEEAQNKTEASKKPSGKAEESSEHVPNPSEDLKSSNETKLIDDAASATADHRNKTVATPTDKASALPDVENEEADAKLPATDSESQDPRSVTPEASSKVAQESDEEGAVSESDIKNTKQGGEAEKVKSDDKAGTDPLSFVIPKKRSASSTSGNEPKSVVQPEALAKKNPANHAVRMRAPLRSPVTPAASPSPLHAPEPPKHRTKAIVPLNLHSYPLDKDFMRVAKKTNSLVMAASITSYKTANPRYTPKSISTLSPFGCTNDRYGVVSDSGSVFVEKTTRMMCATRKDIKKAAHPASFFGVSMVPPPVVVGDANKPTNPATEAIIPAYEKLQFDRPEDRDFYQKRLYGTTFVPQMLRERVTLVMRNARYVRKATGMHFNLQRDKELYATQLEERYTMNRTVPHCDIMQRSWQLLADGRPSFVNLHYMNKEDAMLARAKFTDDDGQALIVKGESGSSINPVRVGVVPGASPLSSPPQLPPRRRSRSPPPGRDRGGPWPPHGRDRRQSQSFERGRGRYGPGGPGAADQGPRSPPRRRSRSRSRSRPRTHDRVMNGGDYVHERDPGYRAEDLALVEKEASQHSSQATTATQDSAGDGGGANGEEMAGHDSAHFNNRRESMGQSPRHGGPPRSRSRSRGRLPPDDHRGRDAPFDRTHGREHPHGSGEFHEIRRGRSRSPQWNDGHQHHNPHGRRGYADDDRHLQRDQHHARADERRAYHGGYDARHHR